MKLYIFSSIQYFLPQELCKSLRTKDIYLVNINNGKKHYYLSQYNFNNASLLFHNHSVCFFAKKNMKYFRGKTNASLNFDNN